MKNIGVSPAAADMWQTALVTWALPGSVRVARGIDLIVLSDTSVIFKTHKRAWKRYELSIVDIIITDSGD